MHRVTISLDESLAEAFDVHSSARGYTSRSEAVRDLVRKAVDAGRAEGADGGCVANLSYVYNHHTRSLAQRLAEIAHDHHDLIAATMHVHLDHENCLESVILKGDIRRVRAFANGLLAERGVTFGELNLVSVVSSGGHHHDAAHHHGAGGHLTPVHASSGARG